MLYKFKSEAGGDVIMLEASGKEILQIIGKDPHAKGILLPEQMPDAVAALKVAITREESTASEAAADTQISPSVDRPDPQRISLRQRAWPFIMLMERSAAMKVPITWGV